MEKRRNCSLGAISPLFHNIFYMLLDFHVKAGTRFSFRDKRGRDNESTVYIYLWDTRISGELLSYLL